jgi:hypothetical protein
MYRNEKVIDDTICNVSELVLQEISRIAHFCEGAVPFFGSVFVILYAYPLSSLSDKMLIQTWI